MCVCLSILSFSFLLPLLFILHFALSIQVSSSSSIRCNAASRSSPLLSPLFVLFSSSPLSTSNAGQPCSLLTERFTQQAVSIRHLCLQENPPQKKCQALLSNRVPVRLDSLFLRPAAEQQVLLLALLPLLLHLLLSLIHCLFNFVPWSLHMLLLSPCI